MSFYRKFVVRPQSNGTKHSQIEHLNSVPKFEFVSASLFISLTESMVNASIFIILVNREVHNSVITSKTAH